MKKNSNKSPQDTEQLTRWDGNNLPYDKVENFNQYGYARVDKGGLLGLIRMHTFNGMNIIDEYLQPSANRILWRKGGSAVYLEFGTQNTLLNLPEIELPSAKGTLKGEYNDPEDLLRDIESIQNPGPNP